MYKKMLLIASSLFSLVHLHGEELPISLNEPALLKLDAPTKNEDIHNKYGYFTYGFGVPGIFNLNLGVRNQHNHHGFEYGIGAIPLVIVYEVHAFTSYLYYPNPCLESQFYFGVGVRGGYANIIANKFEKGAGYLSPGIIFGKSYQKGNDRRFFQVAATPAGYSQKKFRASPSINISYGYCF